MPARKQKSTVGSFTRGSEIWMHQARLFAVATWWAAVIALVCALLAGGLNFYRATTPLERYALQRNLTGRLCLALSMQSQSLELYIDGQPHRLRIAEVVARTEPFAAVALAKLDRAVRIGEYVLAGIMLTVALFWVAYGRAKMRDTRLRGSQLVSGRVLKRLMKRRDDCSPYQLAGVPIRKGAETLHTLIAGAQGVGKSQQFFNLIEQVMVRGKRGVVYDPSGEYVQRFYRPGKDIVMNPLDARSPFWSVWHEIRQDYHFDSLANGLIPDPAEADPFWSKAGRIVLKSVYRALGRQGKRTNRALYEAIAMSNLEELHKLLEGTAGASYVHPITERTGMNIKMTVQNHLEPFRFLPDDGEPFSIRDWVQNESDTWMFISTREEQRSALAPLLSLWLDTAIKAVLSMEPIHVERLWFFLDELPTLQKLDILPTAVTNTRKYGLCLVLGVQDFSQLNLIYGRELAKTLISNCQTKLLLRLTDGTAARQLAELLGQAEIDEREENLSFGIDPQRDGVAIYGRRSLRDMVLSSEILTLPDMAGYIQTPGDYPIARVQYGYTPRAKRVPGFVEREGFAIRFPLQASGAHAPAAAPLPPVADAL